MIIVSNLSLMTEKIKLIKCEDDTKAYIEGIFTKYLNSRADFSKNSITLLFAEARAKHNFIIYQDIGDWIFFANIMAPNHLRYASKDYYDTIAKSSYDSCYKLINRQWKLFEELSDNFESIENQVKTNIWLSC